MRQISKFRCTAVHAYFTLLGCSQHMQRTIPHFEPRPLLLLCHTYKPRQVGLFPSTSTNSQPNRCAHDSRQPLPPKLSKHHASDHASARQGQKPSTTRLANGSGPGRSAAVLGCHGRGKRISLFQVYQSNVLVCRWETRDTNLCGCVGWERR